MKKYVLYSVTFTLLLVLIIAGSTYAFLFTSLETANNSLFSKTTSLNIIYNGGEPIDDPISVALKKEDGYNTTVSIKIAPNSVAAKTNLYIHIDEITENIAIDGFIWEVYGYKNGSLVYSNQGDFEGYNDTTNSNVPIVTDYLLSEDNTDFIVYFWIDGSKTDNDVIGGSFRGYIGATSEEFSARLH